MLYFLMATAFVLRMSSGISYSIATLKNRAQPNPITWFLWALIPLISLIINIVEQGFSWQMLAQTSLILSPILVFLAAIIKNPKAIVLDLPNVTCLILTTIAFGLLFIYKEGFWAIVLSILADFASSLPTLYKAAVKPFSEYAPAYLFSAVSMILTLFTIGRWNFTNSAYLVYVLTLNLIISTLTISGRLRRIRQAAKS